jgi:hypothetical protein
LFKFKGVIVLIPYVLQHYDLFAPINAQGSTADCNSHWGNVCTIGEDANVQKQVSENNVEDGGQAIPSSMAPAALSSASSCVHGECYADDIENPIAKCKCDPGWGGDHCNRQLVWLEFNRDAFLKFRLNYDVDDRADNSFDILVLPGISATGGIASAVGATSSQPGLSSSSFIRLEMARNRMRAAFDSDGVFPGSATTELELPEPVLNSTTPYYIQFYRSPAR